MTRHFLTFLVLIVCTSLSAQQFNFSLIDFTEQRVNPAWLGMDNQWGVSLVQRQQNRVGDFKISSTSLQAVYPQLFPNGKRIKGALGVNLMNDVSGQVNRFKVQEVGLNYSLRLISGKGQSLGLGIGVSHQNRGFDYAGVTTNTQYVTGRGFDLNIGTGENLISTRQNFNRINLGLFWQSVNLQGRKTGHFGLSVYDLNRPVDSFYSDAVKFDPTYILTLGASLFENLNWSLYPEALVVNQVGGFLYNVGLSTTRHFGAEQSLAFKPRYLIGKELILAAEYQKERFVFGVAYDVPIHANVTSNQGAVEFGLKYMGKVKDKTRKRRRRTTPVMPRPNRKEAPLLERAPINSQAITRTLPIENIADTISKTLLNDAGKATIESEMTFYFATNQTSLIEQFRQDLLSLIEDLEGERKFVVAVEGHTDSTGPEELNKKLSLKRAQIVANYLLKAGIEQKHIKIFGRGEHSPLASNQSPAGRAVNRRVEVRVVSY